MTKTTISITVDGVCLRAESFVLVKKVVVTVQQRNCLLNDTCFVVVRTGRVVSALDETPLGEVSVSGDVWRRL